VPWQSVNLSSSVSEMKRLVLTSDMCVKSINCRNFFKVPTTPPFIEGLINLRGKVLTVFNLRKRLGMQDKDFDENCKIIVVNYKDFLVGFTVDMVSEIVKVPEENIEDTPPSITGFDKRFLSGVAKVDEKLILMLDLTKVLSPDEENDIKEFIDENKASVLEQD